MEQRIGLQIYSVRDKMKHDFAGTMNKVAAMGYKGVEIDILIDKSDNVVKIFEGVALTEGVRIFQDLGLEVISASADPPVGEDSDKILDAVETSGCKRLVTGKNPPDFETLNKIGETCALFNTVNEVVTKRGMELHLHNHWWEFEAVEGQLAYKVMLEHLAPEICFEIDTYWVRVGGCDPELVVKELGPRVKLLHIKDGPGDKEQAMTAVGAGIMNFPPIVHAAEHAEWLSVEIDRCDTDMMAAVDQSIGYLRDVVLGYIG